MVLFLVHFIKRSWKMLKKSYSWWANQLIPWYHWITGTTFLLDNWWLCPCCRVVLAYLSKVSLAPEDNEGNYKAVAMKVNKGAGNACLSCNVRPCYWLQSIFITSSASLALEGKLGIWKRGTGFFFSSIPSLFLFSQIPLFLFKTQDTRVAFGRG